MSDNFHDTFEEGIRDNAGHLALAGALFAHSQRKQQLQSLEASRQHQAEIAKTEAQRLEIEKQRLELEKLKQQAEKDEKEAVRLLRVMMAEVGADFEFLASRGQLKGTPQGVRRDYAMAVLLSKLAVVRSRSSSLSDLNDLKELSRLENLARNLVDTHFPVDDPLEVTRTKWRELQVWMDGVERLEKEVKQACSVVPAQTSVQLPSQADLVAMQANLEAFAAQLTSELSEHNCLVPAEAAPVGVLLTELAEQAQLEDLSAGKQASRAEAFASRWRQAATTRIAKEPGMLSTNEIQPGLVQEIKSAIEIVQQWQCKAADHDKTLQGFKFQLDEGRLNEAEVSVKKLSKLRFAGLNYQSISELQKLGVLLDSLATAKWRAAIQLVTDLRKKYPRAANQSDLCRLLDEHEKRALEERRNAIAKVVLLICLTAGIIVAAFIIHLEQQRLVAYAKDKSEAIKAAFLASNGSDTISLGANVKMELAFIMPGTFTMGSPGSEDDRRNVENQVKVVLSLVFGLAKTEVTQAQWEAVMGSNPSGFKGANLPVENVSRENAQAFIAKLNEKQILPAGWEFALPTEAQWEYACRAGETGPYPGGSLDEVGWYDGNSGNKTHEVGQKKPNAWGLHDMHGNVLEWCADWYEDTLKGGTDPIGPSLSSTRVFRGGGWINRPSVCRASYRNGSFPGYRSNDLGFRPAIVLTQ